MYKYLANFFVLNFIILFSLFISSIIYYSIYKSKIYLNFFRFLLNVFLGLTIIVTGYAIFCVQYKTVMIFNLYFLFAFYKSYPHNTTNFEDTNNSDYFSFFIFRIDKSYKKNYLYLYLTLILSYSLFFFIYYTGEITVWNSTFIKTLGDYNYYSKLSYFLPKSDFENIFANPYIPYKGIFLYHYYEIWLNSFISNLFNLIHVETFIFVTYPLFVFLIVTGILTLIEYFNFNLLNHLLIYFVAFILIFCDGFLVSIDGIFFSKFISYYTLIQHKYFVIQFYFILLIILFINSYHRLFSVLCLQSLTFYSIIFPIIYVSLLFTNLLQYFFLKKISKNMFIHIVLEIFIVSILLLIFILFFGFKQNSFLVLNKNIKIIIVISLVVTVNLSVYIFPFILALLIQNRLKLLSNPKKYIHYFIIVVTPIIISIVFYVLFFRSHDSIQFYINLSYPYLLSLIILFFISLLINKKYILFTILTVFLLGNKLIVSRYTWYSLFYKRNYSMKEELVQINNIFQNNRRAVYFENIKDIDKEKLAKYYSNTFSYGSLHAYNLVYPDFFSVVLNVHDYALMSQYKEDNKRHIFQNNIDISIFNQYTQKLKSENKFISIEDAQLQFIKDYDIKFVITDLGVELPEKIKQIVGNKKVLESKIIYSVENNN